MKLAIMQPYYFPYIGYWQLIQSVDRFVIYDDVNYIKRGWVNRNRILINGEPRFITVPLQSSSQNKRICDIQLQPSNGWRNKSLRMLEVTYGRSLYFDDVFPVLENMIANGACNLAEYLAGMVTSLMGWMDIKTDVVLSSRIYGNDNVSGEKRIMDICKRENADIYVNPQGGRELYTPELFSGNSIDLFFLKTKEHKYKQFGNEFVPWLSIIDVMMFNSQDEIREMLLEYDLYK